MLKSFGVWMTALLLAACGVPKPRPASPAAPVTAPPTAATPPGGAGVFRVDPQQSGLRVLVHRTGAMARLGHNHVIDNDGINGWVRFSGDIPSASFALTVPVAGFVVDAPEARSEEGPDFTEPVTDEAKDGTRHNLLSRALLDGERYPVVGLTSLSLTVPSDAPPVGGVVMSSIAVSVAGHQSTISVPLNIETSAGRISVLGSVDLRQTALGLTPFSVMLGALQVQDEITIKFHLVAVTN